MTEITIHGRLGLPETAPYSEMIAAVLDRVEALEAVAGEPPPIPAPVKIGIEIAVPDWLNRQDAD